MPHSVTESEKQSVHEPAATPDNGDDPKQPDNLELTESDKYFQAEGLDESRKRYATYSLWAGLLSILLLLIPNPIPWLIGPVAIVLGIHALIRIYLQPDRHAGTTRALFGIMIGLLATLACRYWLH